MSIQRIKAEDKGVRLVADYNLINDPIIVHDEMRIQQVILNLQSNAIKFTDKGKIIIRVERKYEKKDNFLVISVIDSGIGIKEKDQSKLFKLFGYIQDSKQMNIHGIGLGLTISQKIVEQFGG